MHLPEFSIRRPVTVLMVCAIAILIGTVAFVQIPVDLMPEIVFPQLSISATYEGVAPEEVENLVTRPIEEAVSSAPGVEEVTSRSTEGQSYVRVAFSYGTDLDEAANDLRSRLDRRRELFPEEMDPPVIYKFDVSQFPIMFLSVAASDMDQKQLRHFVEKNIRYRLERVPGIAQFTVRGGLSREIHVKVDPVRLRALDISLADVVSVIRSENRNTPAGPLREGRYKVLLRTQGEFHSLDEIEDVVVASRNGVPIRLGAVATVEDAHEDRQYLVSVDGEPAIRLYVYKQSGANTVQVSENLWKEVDKIHRDYPNVQIRATMDSADFIRRAIGNVQNAAALGALLAVAVLLFFLRNLASTIIIGVAIPVAVISTFALMYFNGFTLNTVSFGGLVLGVGMLVDNSIVVLENIFRHREDGHAPRKAAVQGSREVATAITASTLTTVSVFVPVLFLSGISAQTFQQLAWVVSFALLCSLLVALTIVPMLASRYIGRRQKVLEPSGGVAGAAKAAVDSVGERYESLLAWAITHRKTVVFCSVLACAMSVVLARNVGFELQPEVDEGEVRASVELAPGTTVEVTNAVMNQLADIARRNIPEANHIMIESGSRSPWRGGGQNNGELRISLVEQSKRARSAREIATALEPLISGRAGMITRVRVSTGLFGRLTSFGAGDGDRLEVEVRGHDFETLKRLAMQVQTAMAGIRGVTNTEISQKPGQPEITARVDRSKAASMGLNVGDVAQAFETAVGGTTASRYREEGDEYDILVRLAESPELQPADVGRIPLRTPSGEMVAAKSIVWMDRREGPISINRIDRQRVISVSGTIAGRDLGSVVADLDTQLRHIQRPADFEFVYGGEYEEQQEAFRQLTLAALLALALVYMVMASQFESLRDPLIILFSIPLAGIGVVMILLLTNTTFNIQGFLGLIVLTGIVVNNAIVLIDYTNQLRRDYGLPLRDAILAAGRRRLRPILMTTTTTVLGLIPMALGLGEGGELQAPLARVVIGGLTTSTLITLVFIPVLYMMVESRGERFRKQLAHGGTEEAPHVAAARESTV